MTHLETLERIASLTQNLDLEIILATETDARRTMDSLTSIRRDLDDTLVDLRAIGREESA